MLNRSVRIAVGLTAWLPALAAAQRPTNVTRGEEVIEASGRWMGRPVLLDTMVVWTTNNASAARTFAAAVRTIQYLELPFERADSARRLIVNRRLVTRKIAGKSMAHWFRCGQGMTGEYANTWRVTMAYAVFSDSSSAETARLGVALFAAAWNPEGSSSPQMLCASTGNLEAEIARLVGQSSSVVP